MVRSCVTISGSLGTAWNNGGPVAAVWGWVWVAVMTMTVVSAQSLSMNTMLPVVRQLYLSMKESLI